MLEAFQDELREICASKIAASHGLTHVSKSRKGARPISAENLLAKDRDGSLYKKKHADSAGNPQDVRGDSKDDPGAAPLPRRRGEGPSAGSMIEPGQKTGAVSKPRSLWKRLTSLPTEAEKQRAVAQADLDQGRLLQGGAVGAGATALGLGAITPRHLHEILGGQPIYHGTTNAAAQAIRSQGLDPAQGGNAVGGGAGEGSTFFRRTSLGKAHVTTSPSVAKLFADLTQRKAEGKPGDLMTSYVNTSMPFTGKGTVLKGALPYEDFQKRFSEDKLMPHIGTPNAFWTKERVAPEVFQSGIGSIAKKRLKDPGSLLSYMKGNPTRVWGGVGALAAIPALAYAAPKLWNKGKEIRQDAQGRLEKMGAEETEVFLHALRKLSASGYQEITMPVSSGEEMRAGNSKVRQAGDVPSQDSSIATDQPNSRIEPRAQAFTADPSAKRPKRGDVPTSDRNMNLVDRNDLRESTTTVTGLGQNSSNIGAFNSPSEHT